MLVLRLSITMWSKDLQAGVFSKWLPGTLWPLELMRWFLVTVCATVIAHGALERDGDNELQFKKNHAFLKWFPISSREDLFCSLSSVTKPLLLQKIGFQFLLLQLKSTFLLFISQWKYGTMNHCPLIFRYALEGNYQLNRVLLGNDFWNKNTIGSVLLRIFDVSSILRYVW